MKAFTIALFAVVCVIGIHTHVGTALDFTPELLTKVKTDVEECGRTNNLGPEVIEELIAGGDPKHSRNLDCFAACVLKKNGVMNSDGTSSHESDDSDAMKQCKDQKGSDDCDTAAKIMACLDQNNLIPKLD